MKILLPIDGSDCAHDTLKWAAETFDKNTSAYYLLFVVPVLPDLNTAEYDVMDAAALLKKSRDVLEDLGCHVEEADYVLGDTVTQICRYAEEMEVDQVVMGTHGRTGFARLLMGSVSHRVLQHCKRPVTIRRNVEKPAESPAKPYAEHHHYAIPGNTLF